MLKFGNKEFRNLQQQVKKNMDDISFILQEEGVLNEFGIKVVGQEASVIDMPTVADYKEDNPEWSYGDAFAIGTEEPYELYILTRANGTHPDDYWFNIGEFPAPGPQGPEGPQGEVGPQGPTGNPGANGVSPVVGVGTVSTYTLDPGTPAYASVFMTGTQANPSVNYNFYIPRGQDGSAITAVEWGQISGTLTDQTDLVSALQAKANASSLASYATQVYANNVASNATYQANVYTDSQISALSSVYMTEAAVGDYLTDNEYAHIDEIPTDTSDLTNNAGFITNAALSGYATKSYVNSSIAGLSSVYAGLNSNNAFAGINSFSKSIGLLSSANLIVTDAQQNEYTINIPRVSGTLALTNDIPSLSGYATQSWVSSQGYLTSVPSEYATISQVSSAISALDYASVGAMSSETYIPRVGGDNDGTYWTAITLGDDTYSIPQGGGSVAWGSISGTLSNQTDLQTALDSKLDKEVTAGNDSSSIDINETVIGLYSGDPDTNSSLEISKDGVVIQANDDVEGTSTQLTVSDGSVTITRDSDGASIELFDLASMSYVDDSISALSSIYQPIGSYATVSALSSAVSDINTTISSLDYASVGALSASTVIPDITGLASETYVDNSISALSSVYAPLSDYASQAWVSANFLSSGYVPVVSGYASLSGNNEFTGRNVFREANYNYGSIYFGRTVNAYANIYASTPMTGNPDLQINLVNAILGNSTTYDFTASNLTKNGTAYALVTDIPSVSGYANLSAQNVFTAPNHIPYIYLNSTSVTAERIPQIYGSTRNLHVEAGTNGGILYLSDSYSNTTLSQIALKSDIPSVSGYATISALSSAIDSLSSVYAPLSDYASTSYVDNSISALSSIYAPSDYIPTAISGYASEVWTFEVDDGQGGTSSITKTILVG